jgi:hypothetical protein
MVTVQPHFGDVLELMVRSDFLGREVVVVINDG